MDLSSLEGPPINDPRVVVIPEYMDELGRVRLEPPTPVSHHNPHPSRLWRSLPPRPASAEPTPTSPHDHYHYHHNPLAQETRPPHFRADTSLSDGQLRRAPAQRGRRTPSPEIDMDINLHMELHIERRGTPHDERSRSRPLARALSPTPLNLEISAYDRQSGRGRRTRSCCPLVWVEAEERWVVFGPFPHNQQDLQQQQQQQQQSRTPGPSIERTPDSYWGLGGNEELAEHPPTYESHGFSPTYVTRLGGRWDAVARRVHLSSG